MSSQSPFKVDATFGDSTEAEIRVAQLYNTNTSTNLNNLTATLIPLGGTQGIFDADFSQSNDGIVTNFDGRVRVAFSIHCFAAVTRINLTVQVHRNGSPIGPVAAHGYIRDANGHQETNYSIPGVWFVCADGDLFEVFATREANSGNKTLAQSGTSILQLERIINVPI